MFKEKTHSFDLEDVKKYGSIEKALIVKEFRQMALYKIRNNKSPWVYYSRRALAKKFSYMKDQSIGRWLNELEKNGFLESKIENKHRYDKTKSYLLTEFEDYKNETSMAQNEPSVVQNEPGMAQNEPTIPSLSSSLSSSHVSKETEQSSYGREDINEIIEFLKEEVGGSLDGTVKENRNFAKLLLDKLAKDYPDFNNVEQAKMIIRAARSDSFHAKNATGIKYIYYHTQRIIQSIKQYQSNFGSV